MTSQPVPRYRQISDQLRHRIVTGQLRPGDRVPSTRQITEEWSVAIATASRVLATLREQGLVQAVPGIGTIVLPQVRAAHPPTTGAPSAPGTTRTPTTRTPTAAGSTTAVSTAPSPTAPSPTAPSPTATPPGPAGGVELSRAAIVDAAVAIADTEGMAALSMRRVAAELSVATMSLYRHVHGKEDLLRLMTDAVFARYPLPSTPGRRGSRAGRT